ncbi:mannose-1-phosphate guanylyltransferase/mannose-6-phosphate isomerase [Microbulbifer thermotolerans]|uniref:mannose-1-phosphate guanylyltransferase/mannose-6-phosphate isomerase n=1 Tax=Microbulbifer thermotolerans TaxID=252514 RepID=UPI00224ABA40|nr:mannose-1-phosphate guanylyltransferase/mannose-6-phosphate isomerase [Microbulbifer thermotolerans]MCX2780152.1 mannose-1-phosphate guanylyltransferase/mannose-6-phosphate isomerase [Microbulbifer thermotolerans]MCX2805576.1 mannose-1-phosphate guanylyltransferase/mannose-6-phosphate isomerase [Microbulbifer thermotolerans]
MKIVPVIMAGGSGSRLWPASRQLMPKQFLNLMGDKSMLVETVNRLGGLPCDRPIVICNDDHRFIAAEELRVNGTDDATIILEPVGRNTAPAIALAALAANPDDILLVLAADHVIKDRGAFHHAVESAMPFAEQGKLVTFGVVPRSPHTGYGYIRAESIHHASPVLEFVEKPDLEKAQRYLKSGCYYWNSGMFMFRAENYLAELQVQRPEIVAACRESMNKAEADLSFLRPDAEVFKACPEDSIDYAVMEHTKNAFVVPMDAQWSDIGCWASLWEISDKDVAGNVTRGDVIVKDSSKCYIDSASKLVAAIGLDDVVIVDTKDALLVANRNDMQKVKEVVQRIKEEGRNEVKHGREVYRPWGHYDSIDFGPRDQVKRITVKPGAKLSVQMHHHRAEHWIVVSGTAKVTIGDETKLLSENESVYIPIGKVHSLENPGRIPLEMIEVQTGSYLGEDDIVRFQDKYGRV